MPKFARQTHEWIFLLDFVLCLFKRLIPPPDVLSDAVQLHTISFSSTVSYALIPPLSLRYSDSISLWYSDSAPPFYQSSGLHLLEKSRPGTSACFQSSAPRIFLYVFIHRPLVPSQRQHIIRSFSFDFLCDCRLCSHGLKKEFDGSWRNSDSPDRYRRQTPTAALKKNSRLTMRRTIFYSVNSSAMASGGTAYRHHLPSL